MMKNKRSLPGMAQWGSTVFALAMLGSLLSASAAQAQVQTFFVNVPATSEQRDAMELCRDRFTAALVRVGGFRANQDAVTQQSVTDCLGENASAAAKRECEVSMANIEVDFLIQLVVRRLGSEWNWAIKALSPAQGAAQVWGGDQSSVETDASKSAYGACDALGREFACNQGVASACGASFGTGPVLVAAERDKGAAMGEMQPRRSPVSMSALDVFGSTPAVVSVWIDGREAGSSSNQINGIAAGRHEVTLKATGFSDHTETLNFGAGVPAELRDIRLRSTTATLQVEMTEPATAEILIDGRPAGRTGGVLSGLAPGRRQVVLRAKGYREKATEITFEADRAALMREVRLDALPARVSVTVNVMGAEVLVDGRLVGRSSGGTDDFDVVPTAQTLEVKRDGYVTRSERLSLQPASEVAFEIQLRRGTGREGTGFCPDGFVLIEPGTFMMGAPPGEEGRDRSETQHQVTLTRAFCMKATEITQGEWQRVIKDNPSEFKRCGANCPVEQVSWDDAVFYANALSRREGLPECYAGSTFAGLGCRGYRLPTEAEWEYAARAGTTAATYGNLDRTAWYGQREGETTHLVRQKQPNAWGLYDMLGNVWEWTADWSGTYPGTVTDPTGAVASSYRMIRGGSWYDPASYARAAIRSGENPITRSSHLGFRLVRTAP